MARGIGNGVRIDLPSFWQLPADWREDAEQLAVDRYNAVADEPVESFFDLPPRVRTEARDEAVAEYDRRSRA